MKEYIQFISRVLWACFFMAILGASLLYLTGYTEYVLGWLWGIVIIILYVLLLAAQLKQFGDEDAHRALRKTGRNVLSRLVLVGAFTVIGLRFPEINPYALGIAVAIMQPILFIQYWRLSKTYSKKPIEK